MIIIIIIIIVCLIIAGLVLYKKSDTVSSSGINISYMSAEEKDIFNKTFTGDDLDLYNDVMEDFENENPPPDFDESWFLHHIITSKKIEIFKDNLIKTSPQNRVLLINWYIKNEIPPFPPHK
jgi:hypothetical protein